MLRLLTLLALCFCGAVLAHDPTSAEQMKSRLKPVPSSLDKLDFTEGDPKPPRYKLSQCGEGAICCEYERGERGASCQLFKMLCQAGGGKASGNAEDAQCQDWH